MNWFAIKKYIAYRLNAGNAHGLHSPFVYKLYTEAIASKHSFYAYSELDNIRKQLLQNETIIEVHDLGAGSYKMNRRRKVSAIAKYSIIQKKYGELLFRLIDFFKPTYVLELGTSLGISSLYMSKARSEAKIISVEGCADTFAFAKELLQKNKAKNIQLVNSSFEDFFHKPPAKKFDLVFIDGNHTYEATLGYFHLLEKHTHENSVLIFDDICWSEGMAKAWEEIKKDSNVTLTIDLYKAGLVFFRKENKQKENFVLKY